MAWWTGGRADARPRTRLRIAVVAFLGSAGFLAVLSGLGGDFLQPAAEQTARAGAGLMGLLGAPAAVGPAGLVTTRSGTFVVTPECVTTPLMPAYLAAVFGLPLSRRRRTLALLAFVPLFAALGVGRLLVLALPPALGAPPPYLVHAFRQVVLGAALVLAAACLRARRLHAACALRAVGAIALGLAAGLLL